MSVNFEFKKKIRVDGKDYESLDQVPPEQRAAIDNALANGAATAKVTVNGKTYGSMDELPFVLRTIVRGLAGIALKGETPSAPPALRPEPLVGAKFLVFAIGLTALVAWLVYRA